MLLKVGLSTAVHALGDPLAGRRRPPWSWGISKAFPGSWNQVNQFISST